MTLQDQIAQIAAAQTALAERVAALEIRGIGRNEYFDRFTDAEMDRWTALRDDANQTPPDDRTDQQKAVLRGWTYFTNARAVEMDHPYTIGGTYALHLWGVLEGAWRVNEVLEDMQPDSTQPEADPED